MIIDKEATSAVITAGIKAADQLATPDHKSAMLNAVLRAANKHTAFTADDVWSELGAVGGGGNDDGSSLGPLMLRVKSQGIIRTTGTFRRSERPSMHGKPIPVWASAVTGVVDNA